MALPKQDRRREHDATREKVGLRRRVSAAVSSVHKINLPGLKNLAMYQFRKRCFEASLVPGPEEIKPIYERTSPSSPFRKLISQIAAMQIADPFGKSDFSKYRDCFAANTNSAIDVTDTIKDGAGGKLLYDPIEEDECEYHEHQFGRQCSPPPFLQLKSEGLN